MTEKIKRKLQAIYLNTAASGAAAPAYALLGVNVAELSLAYNPQTTTEQDIVSDTASTDVTGYQPNAPVTQKASKGDEVYEYINKLRRNRAILDDCCTDIVLVDLYDEVANAEGKYLAEK